MNEIKKQIYVDGVEQLVLECDKLPILIIFRSSDGILKEYILKTNNEKTKLLLNKKDF